MASAFSHAAIPAVLYAVFKSKAFNFRVFVVAVLFSILPDADVIAFEFGIPYQSQWGHRGFTHSIVFALALALVASAFYKILHANRLTVFLVGFVSCISHALLDALTNGGLGVALYWPFSLERVFFPFRPIQVSPIGAARFFSEKGLKVILSEAVWVLMPSLIIGYLGALIRKYRQRNF